MTSLDTRLSVLKGTRARILPGRYWYVRVDRALQTRVEDAFASFSDDIETAYVLHEASLEQLGAPSGLDSQGPFSAFRFDVAVPFNTPGFIRAVSSVVADLGLPILIISTFSKDYAYIRDTDTQRVRQALEKTGVTFAL